MKERVKDPRRAFRRREIVGRDVRLLRTLTTYRGDRYEKGTAMHCTEANSHGWVLYPLRKSVYVSSISAVQRRDFEVLL